MYYDLHLHSCLSPCGDMDMTPNNIVNMAALNGLEVIALTDHNTSLNCPAAIEVGKQVGIIVLPGMELTTSEEVHVVCLFDNLKSALEFSNYVYGKLPDIPNAPGIFGEQVIMNENDEPMGKLDKLLINATTISVSDIVGLINDFGGFCYPAHIDRSSNSIISNIGDIPPECGFTAAEISKTGDDAALMEQFPIVKNMRRIHSSDAHYLPDMGDAIHQLHPSEKTARGVLEYLKSHR